MGMRLDHTLNIELPEKCWILPTAIEYWCGENCSKKWFFERTDKRNAILHFYDDNDSVLFQLSSFTPFIRHT